MSDSLTKSRVMRAAGSSLTVCISFMILLALDIFFCILLVWDVL